MQQQRGRSFGSKVADFLGLGLDHEVAAPWDDAELREWEARANELARCAQLVEAGGVERVDGCPVAVRDEERVFLVLKATSLVDSNGKIVALGTTTITNSRVVFHSPVHFREWDFNDVIATPHDEASSSTYFQLSSGEPTFGVQYPFCHAEAFRLRLTVALAWAEGNPSVVFPRVKAAIDAHMARRPA